MAGTLPPVYVEFKGDVTGLATAIATAQGQLNQFSATTNQATGATHGLNAGTVALGGTMAIVLTQMLSKVKEFGASLATEFVHVGSEVKSLSRFVDGTTEDISRLRYAANRFGVDSGVVSMAVRNLSRHLASNDQAAKNLGISYKDSQGNLLPTIDILKRMADQYNSLPNKVQANAYLFQEFGRQGAAMAPLLALGSKGIEELGAEADKLGLTLTGGDLANVKAYNEAHAKLRETIEAVKISIGRNLLPILTQSATTMANIVAIASEWVKTHQDLVKGVAAGIGVIGSATAAFKLYQEVTQAVKEAQKALTAVWTFMTGPIGLVLIAIVALVAGFIYAYKHSATFAKVVTQAVQWVGETVGKVIPYIVKALKFMLRVWLDVADGILKVAQAIDSVTGKHFASQLSAAAATLSKFRSNVNTTLDSIAANAPAIGERIGNSIQGFIDAAANFSLKDMIAKLTAGLSGITGGGAGGGTGDGGGGGGDGGGSGRSGSRRASTLRKEIAAINEQRKQLDAAFATAVAGAGTLEERAAVALQFKAQADALLAAAKAEEVKTRHTKAHAAAVRALAKANAEYQKVMTYVNGVTADALAAQQALEEQLRKLNSMFTASNSWLAAQTRTSGPQRENFGGFIEVPIYIDGQVVFRSVQRYSLQNDLRNPTNGLSTSGSLI